LQERHFAGGFLHMYYARISRCQNTFCTAASYDILFKPCIVYVRDF
jgi:hypothetical protein